MGVGATDGAYLFVGSRDGRLSDGRIFETNKHPFRRRKKKTSEHKHSHRICTCYRTGRPYPNRLFIDATCRQPIFGWTRNSRTQPGGISERARAIRLIRVWGYMCWSIRDQMFGHPIRYIDCVGHESRDSYARSHRPRTDRHIFQSRSGSRTRAFSMPTKCSGDAITY